MKIALISDIHSNLFYFEKVLHEIEKENVDDIYCLGDLVGYYDKPNEVIDLIKKKDIKCIKGNHDKYLLNELPYDLKKDEIYGIKQQRELLSNENFKFLRNLKDEIVLEINNKKIYMTHSFPNNCERYLYNLDNLNLEFLKEYDYYFFGHTHIPIITYHYGTCIVNPGSIGQPRDHTKQSSYAIVDFKLEEVKIKKVNHDIDVFTKELKNEQYAVQLIDILKRGRNEKN
ncbi:metallophosphoesterase family protein [Aliarcobacter butzleri]|uniref:Phosphoesterase n=1 Tax=Aliarcobacter butzleri TaxID=28197 RepID=A0AAW7PMP8_9BACT|nr:metallophosphoesterase family protein [Aliarcobacter butzleri]MDN5062712.1 metallophosphoesterase family protein [Aliarcobacter butzleri]MDN5065597.1 metallophosphoesterase family protein [Aliarcobacter butzleri]